MQNPWGIKHSIFPFACFIWLATLFLFRLIYTLSFFSCSFLFPYFYLCLSCKKLSLSVLESLTGYSCLEALESWLKDLNARGRFADSCILLWIDQWADFSMYRIFFKIFFFFFSREESLRLLLVRKLSNGWTYHALCILLFSPLDFDMASYLYLCCCLVPLNEEALIPLFCRVNLPSPATVGKGWPSQHSEKEVRNRLWADVRDTLGCLPNSHFFPSLWFYSPFPKWPWQGIGLSVSTWHNSDQW